MKKKRKSGLVPYQTCRMSVPRTHPVHVPDSVAHPVEETDEQIKRSVFNASLVDQFWTGLPLDTTYADFFVRLHEAQLPIEVVQALSDWPERWTVNAPLYLVGVDNYVLAPYDLRGGWENVPEEMRKWEYDDLPDHIKFKDVTHTEVRKVTCDPVTKKPLGPFVPPLVSVRFKHDGQVKTGLLTGTYSSQEIIAKHAKHGDKMVVVDETVTGNSFHMAIIKPDEGDSLLHIPVEDIVGGIPEQQQDTRPSIKCKRKITVTNRVVLVEDLKPSQRIDRKNATPAQQFTGAFLKELRTMRCKDTDVLDYVLRNGKVLVLMACVPYTNAEEQVFQHRAIITLRRKRTDVDDLLDWWKSFINDTLNYHTPQNVEKRRCADLNENTLHMNSKRNRTMGLSGIMGAKVTDMRKITIKCRPCKGTGLIKEVTCRACNGLGHRQPYLTMHISPNRQIKIKGKIKEGKPLFDTLNLEMMLVPAFDGEGKPIFLLDSEGKPIQAQREVQAARNLKITRNKPKGASGADIAARIQKDVFPVHLVKWYPEQVLTMGAAANTTCQNPALHIKAHNISRLQKEHLVKDRKVSEMPVYARRIALGDGTALYRQYAAACPECGHIHIYQEAIPFSIETLNEVPEWQALMKANPLRKLKNRPWISPEEQMRLSDDQVKAILDEVDRRTMYAVEAIMSGFSDGDVVAFTEFKMAADEMEAGGQIYSDAQRAKCLEIAYSVMG